MSVLEDRYRKVLRILPASYRMEWEDEMVATFLASMETDDPDDADHLAEFGRPSVAEVASVAALAVRLRLGGVEAPPRSFLWGEAVRRVALVGLLANAATTAMMTLRDIWLTGGIPWLSPSAELRALTDGPAFDTAAWAVWVCSLAAIPAYLALVYDQRRVAWVLAALTLVRPAVRATSSIVEAVGGGAPLEYFWLAQAMAGTACVLALAAFHREAPAVRRKQWLLAGAIALGVSALVEAVFLMQNLSRTILLDPPGVACSRSWWRRWCIWPEHERTASMCARRGRSPLRSSP